MPETKNTFLKRFAGALGLQGLFTRNTNPNPESVLGSASFMNTGGFIQTVEKNPFLDGRNRYITYSDIIANCPTAAAGVRYFLNVVAMPAWRAEPANDSQEAKDMAQTVSDILFKEIKTPWHSIVRRDAMMKYYGFSIQEWVAQKRPDGTIGFRDVMPRPQHTLEKWDTNEAGDVLGVVQRAPQDSREIYLPRSKITYVTDDSIHDTPEGVGLFRHIVKLAQDLARLEQLEGFAFETDLRGIPVGRAPAEALETGEGEPVNQLVTGLVKFINDHVRAPGKGSGGVVLPSDVFENAQTGQQSNSKQWDLELLSHTGKTQSEVDSAIRRKQREIARVLGVDKLLLGDSERGSFALSRDKTNNFRLIVESTLKELAEQYQRDYLGTLWRLNNWDPELKPRLMTGSILWQSLEELTTAVRDMTLAGIPLSRADTATKEIFETMGLTPPDPKLELIDLSLVGPGISTEGVDSSDDITPAAGFKTVGGDK